MHLLLNIFNTRVKCILDDSSLLTTLEKDFSYFIDNKITTFDFILEFILERSPHINLSQMKILQKSRNCISYREGNLTYFDYFSDALSIYDFKQNTGKIYSTNKSRLHELAYLQILSRTAKQMDLRGFHKIHAMSVCYDNLSVIVSMDMGGGKTSLFLDMLKFDSISIISDDSPVIDPHGNVNPFPLRVGVNECRELANDLQEYSYEISRKEYGKKTLIPISSFSNNISAKSKKIIIMKGRRVDGNDCVIKSISIFSILTLLFRNMFIGIGLPIIKEYFIEYSLRDWPRLIKIAILRLRATFKLIIHSHQYEIILGTNRPKNSETLLCFLKNYDKIFK